MVSSPLPIPSPVIPILMPQAGQSMEEGTITAWHVKPGDRIETGQVIFEVETDKATVEVEADHPGRLARIAAQVGDIVPVKVPVAYLAENDAEVDAYLMTTAEDQAVTVAPHANRIRSEDTASSPGTPTFNSVPPVSGDRIKASPAARKKALDAGITLDATTVGSGPGGRILSTDVEPAAAAAANQPVRFRMNNMRRAIARNMTASKQSVPHFYMRVTIDAVPLLEFHEKRNAENPCSLNDLIVMASARCVQEFPAFRRRVEGDEYIEIPTANIGIAVGLEEGLVVPVVIGADRMDLASLARETRRLIKAARKGKLEGIGQGVFTISNLGMFGVEEFSAIINPPEAAILAVSAVREQVIVSNGAMRPGKIMTMTLSSDHRVIDGVMAARFCARLKEILEAPERHLMDPVRQERTV